MIYTGQSYKEGNKPSRKYDEMWTVMCSPTKGLKKRTENHPELAPSPELFQQFLSAKRKGGDIKLFFQNEFEDTFLHELAEREEARKSFEYLFNNRNNKDIILMCSCAKDSICHRSILRGILAGAAASVTGGRMDGIALEGTTRLSCFTKYTQYRTIKQ